MTDAGEASWAEFAEAIFAVSATAAGLAATCQADRHRRISDPGAAAGEFAARQLQAAALTACACPIGGSRPNVVERLVCGQLNIEGI